MLRVSILLYEFCFRIEAQIEKQTTFHEEYLKVLQSGCDIQSYLNILYERSFIKIKIISKSGRKKWDPLERLIKKKMTMSL